MSHIAQKRPFASLVEKEEVNEPLTSAATTPLHEPLEEEEEEEKPRTITSQESRFCLDLVKKLMKHKRSVAFNAPVDPVLFNIPDYFDIIKQPMDLSTVHLKLQQDRYPTYDSVLADIQLIFDNCYLYNNITDPVCQDAKKLEEHYHKLLKRAPANLAAVAHAHAQVPAAANAAAQALRIASATTTTTNPTGLIPVPFTDPVTPAVTAPTVQPIITAVANEIPQQQQSLALTAAPQQPINTQSPSNTTNNKFKINLLHNTVSASKEQVQSIPLQQPVAAVPSVDASSSQPQLPPLAPEPTLQQPIEQQQQQRSLTVKLPALPTPSSTAGPSKAPKRTHKDTTSTTAADKIDLMPEDQFKRCEAIVKELKKQKYHRIHWPFLKPVDADAWGATDYYDIIKQPMDMETYERKLYEYEYATEDELAADIRQMFVNCFKYNPPHHDVHNYGKEFELVFEEHWEKLHNKKKEKTIGSKSTPSSSSNSKKRRISRDVSSISVNSHVAATTNGNATTQAPVSAAVVEQPQPVNNNHNITVDHSPSSTTSTPAVVTTPTPTATATVSGTPQQPSLKIKLRLNMTSKPPAETKESKPKLSNTPTKPKIPGLALSKEPQTGPKLAIGDTPPAHPIKETKASKAPQVLQNEAQWFKLANQQPATANKRPPPGHATTGGSYHNNSTITARNSPPPQVVHRQKSAPGGGQRRISPPLTGTHKPAARISPPPPPAPPAAPAAPAFDILQITNSITSQAKQRERQEKEKMEKFQRDEKLRLERERIANEEKLQRIREFNQHTKDLREREQAEREQELKLNTCDISEQKMMFKEYVNNHLSRDRDWLDMNKYYENTFNYRGFPRLGFVDRSGVDLKELKAKLLSKCARLRNHQNASSAYNSNGRNEFMNQQEDGDSDMDIE